MKKLLEIEDSYDFSIIGISSHAKDYRLSWELNNALGISLEKGDAILPEGIDGVDGFSSSIFVDEENHLTFELIANKNQGKFLIPECAHMDYLFKISGAQHEYESREINNKIQSIESILKSIEINPNDLKSKPNLVF